MESVAEIKPETTAANERSTVDFPYTDLDASAEVVRGVHNAGGTACDSDQLAAQLNLEAKGGGFRLRIGGAKSFGLITYERGGRVTLTDIGRQIIDSQHERPARMNAFLAVELYQKVFEQFKGGPLPPQAGLDRALVALGVGAGVASRARQTMLRSAKQAGFFEHAADRLVKPAIRQDGGAAAPKDAQRHDDHGQGDMRVKTGGGSGGDGVPPGVHSAIVGLLRDLPPPGTEFSKKGKQRFVKAFLATLDFVYPPAEDDEEESPQ